MEQQIVEALKAKGVRDSSIRLYLSNLRRLNEGQELKNLSFLKNVKVVEDKISHLKPTTRRSYYISISTVLKDLPNTEQILPLYYDKMMEMNKELKVNNEKSLSQTENWKSQDEIVHKWDELRQEIDLKKTRNITEDYYRKVLDFFILSLYVLQPPRRNMDYQNNFIVRKWNDKMIKDINYTDIFRKMFIFNNYKTSGTYSSQTIEMTPELLQIFNYYLKLHPLRQELKEGKAIPLLCTIKGQAFTKNNDITRVLQRIFKAKIGASMLRNIYLTSKYSAVLDELKKDTANMATSLSTAENQYIKV